MTTVITFGTFDLLHIGHVRILRRARAFGDRLVVGVSSDELNWNKKQKVTVYDQDARMEIVAALQSVDQVFLEESLELKKLYILKENADVLIMGDDWKGKFDDMPCKVMYLPRTEDISTTETLSKIKSTK